MKDTSTSSSPTESVPAEQVLVLPGHLFFIETIDLPVDLEEAEIPDFIELSLETIAPFPVEQLNWGYLYSADAPTILVYATHRDRLKNAGYTELQGYTWVLPDFATLTGACFPNETLVELESTNNLSLLLFDKGTSIPRIVLVAPVTDGDANQALKDLKASPSNLPKSASILRIRTGGIELSEQGEATFHLELADASRSTLASDAWTTLAPTEAQLWQADVRSANFKETERSARRLGTLLMRITAWAALFALVLVSIEILLLASQAWLSTLDKQIESQRTAVLTIEDKQALMIKLEQVAKNELRPIAILEAANNIRLKIKLGIEYDSVVVEGENNITIEGKATSINALNSYTESLKQSGYFELITAPESITRAGKTTFTVTLAYTHLDTAAPVEAPAPSAIESPTEEAPI
ncbi:MAG: hypothetical protein P8R37_08165 [Opitutae bacterium]|nr:hypothetical protein [Opitutae bacterium]MDG1301548.1 hypothetical protein [Opitutae bacterium]